MKVNEITAFSAVSAGQHVTGFVTRRTRQLLAAGLLALTGCNRPPPLFELLRPVWRGNPDSIRHRSWRPPSVGSRHRP